MAYKHETIELFNECDFDSTMQLYPNAELLAVTKEYRDDCGNYRLLWIRTEIKEK